MFVVGPESAGANPGPVCYGKGEEEVEREGEGGVEGTSSLAGGPLTVTDANLCLGRLLPE